MLNVELANISSFRGFEFADGNNSHNSLSVECLLSSSISHLLISGKYFILDTKTLSEYTHSMEYEWNENKAALNLAKHGVSFEEAKTVFNDPLYVDFYDPDHSENEHRYIIMGESSRGRLLLVSYTERNNRIRLISSREVTRSERAVYEEG